MKPGGTEETAEAMKFIALKFAGWFVFIAAGAFLLKKRVLKFRSKLVFYGAAVLLFGVFFGPEPSPMHPVKDFIFRLGAMGTPVVLFLAFFAVLLIVSVVLNRSICAWGCHFGVFQDFIHRLFRNKKDTKHILTAYKPPFWIGNTVRALTFVGMVVAAFIFSFDLLGSVDPFKVFSPAAIGVGAGVFIAILVLLSMFFYRPFCHFFCPFGLLSWIASRINIVRIRIDRESCTDCKVCTRACPSLAMKGIYEGKKLPPDCYTCGSCIASCPTGAISFSGPSAGKGK